MRRSMVIVVQLILLAEAFSCGNKATSNRPDTGTPVCRAPSPTYGSGSHFDMLPAGTPRAETPCPRACGPSAYAGDLPIDVALPYGACAPATPDCETLGQMPCGFHGVGATHDFRCSCENGTWNCRIRSLGVGLCDAGVVPDGLQSADSSLLPEAGLVPDAAFSPPDAAPQPDTALPLPAAPCPIKVPLVGSACAQGNACFYEDCAQAGRSKAVCANGLWDVQTMSCGRNPCHSPSGSFDRNCEPGQICVKTSGAIVMPTCYDNPCAGKDGDLLTCLAALYSCPIDLSLEIGATISCTSSSCGSDGRSCL